MNQKSSTTSERVPGTSYSFIKEIFPGVSATAVNVVLNRLPRVTISLWFLNTKWTRRPASADRKARRQFQATGQPVSRTQASKAMTSRLPRYEAKCVQRRCFQCGSVPLRSDIKGTELPPANILIPVERQLTALQLCCWEFLYNELCSRRFVLYCRSCPKDDKFRYFIPILKKLGAA